MQNPCDSKSQSVDTTDSRNEETPVLEKHDLGVLLVHGIGESRRGDTLMQCGSSLARVLGDLMHGSNGRAEFLDTRLQSEPDASDDPPHAELRILHFLGEDSDRQESQRPRNRSGLDTRWLLAESWWGRVFPAPTYQELLAWCFKVVPWTIFAHFDRKLRIARFRSQVAGNRFARNFEWFRWMIAAGGLLVALLLVPVLLVLLLLVLLFDMLPGPFKAVANWIQRTLAQYLGDSYILVGNEVARSAICSRVRRDLHWLAERCQRVAILAHSQGGAIAHEVLRSDPLAPCDWLLTYGSGLGKLSEIRRAEESEGHGWLFVAACGVLLAAAALGFGLLAADDQIDRLGLLWRAAVVLACMGIWAFLDANIRARIGKWLADVLLCVFMFIAVLVVWKSSSATTPIAILLLVVSLGLVMTWSARGSWLERTGRATEREKQWTQDRRLFDRYFRFPAYVNWIDVFSSSDPVPNGPLLDDLLPTEIKSYTISNRGSLIEDHTTYWQNAEQFVWRTVITLLDASGVGGDRLYEHRHVTRRDTSSDARPHTGGDAVRAAHARRNWRVLWLKWLRRLAYASMIVLGWRWWSKAPAWMDQIVNSVRSGIEQIPWVGNRLAGDQHDGLNSFPGIVTLSVTVLLAYAIGRLIWLRWDAIESRTMIRGEALGKCRLYEIAIASYWSIGCALILFPERVVYSSPALYSVVQLVIATFAALTILSVILFWEVAIWIGGICNPYRGVRLLAAGDDPATVVAAQNAFVRAWLVRQGEAGSNEAYLRLGSELEEEAKSLPFASSEQEDLLKEAAAYYELANDEGGARGALFLAWLFQWQAERYKNLPDQNKAIEKLDEAKQALECGAKLDNAQCCYELGLLQREAGETRAAIANLERAAGLNHALALAEVAGHLQQQGCTAEARRLFKKSAELGSSWSLCELGRIAASNGDMDEAADWYSQALANGDDHGALAMGWLYLDDGRSNLAIQMFEEAVRLGSARAAIDLGQLWEDRSEVDASERALHSYDRAYRIGRRRGDSSTAADAVCSILRLHWKAGHETEVRQRVAVEMAEWPDANIAMKIADFWTEARQIDEARKTYQKALDLALAEGNGRSYQRVALGLVELLVEAGDLNSGIRVLSKAFDLFPRLGIVLKLGELRTRADDMKGAEEALRRAHELCISDVRERDSWTTVEAATQLAALLQHSGRKSEGDAILVQTLDFVDRIELMLEIAESWLQTPEDRQRGRETVERALDLARSRCDSAMASRAAGRLATILAEEGQLEKARQTLDEARNAARTRADHRKIAGATFEIVDLLERDEQYEVARELLSETGDESAEAALRLGRNYLTCNETDSATDWLHKATALAREQRDAFVGENAALELAHVLDRLGDSEGARNVLVEAVFVFDTTDLLRELAAFEAEQGETDQAWATYERAFEKASKNDETWLMDDILLRMAELLKKGAHLGEATEFFRSALGRVDDGDTARRVGDAFADSAESEFAFEAYKRAAQLGDREAHARLAELLDGEATEED